MRKNREKKRGFPSFFLVRAYIEYGELLQDFVGV